VAAVPAAVGTGAAELALELVVGLGEAEQEVPAADRAVVAEAVRVVV